MYRKIGDKVVDKQGNVLGIEKPDTGAASVVATIPALFSLTVEFLRSKAKADNREKSLRKDLEWAYSNLEPICSGWRVTLNGVFDLQGKQVFQFTKGAKRFAATLRYVISTLRSVFGRKAPAL